MELPHKNPSVSISAHSRILTESANYVASQVHNKVKLYDFTDSLVERGNKSQSKLKNLFDVLAQRREIVVAVSFDYRNGRHTLPFPYAGIMAYVVDNFRWQKIYSLLKN